MTESTFQHIPAVESAPSYPASHAQKRLWLFDQFESEKAAYNMPSVFYFKGDIDAEAFEKAFILIVKRHESLRTTFREEKGETVQVIHAAEDFDFSLIRRDLRDEANPQDRAREVANEEAAYIFDLKNGPLIRISLNRIDEDNYLFTMNLHHIVSDGWSNDRLVQELLHFYTHLVRGIDPGIKPLRIHYKDFSVWQKNELEGEAGQEHRDYWVDQFNDGVPVIDIPSDFSRPAIKSYEGGISRTLLPEAVAKQAEALCQEQHGSMFMLLLAALNTLFYRYSGQTDIVLGSPTGGRPHKDLEDQIGFYINMLALRTRFKGENTFLELLQEVRSNTLSAYKHQVYPFDKLIEDLKLKKDKSRSPLFDIGLTWHDQMDFSSDISANAENRPPEVPAEAPRGSFGVQPAESDFVISKTDIWFHATRMPGRGIGLSCTFRKDLYKQERIDRMIGHLQNLLQSVIKDVRQPLNRINYLDPAEIRQIVVAPNRTKTSYPAGESATRLFEKQAADTPDAVAVGFEGNSLTYAALNAQSNKLARHLISNYQISPGDRVGLLVPRSEQMIVAIMGILKAGAAYVPLDPDFPKERLSFILDETDPNLLITTSDHLFGIDYYSGAMFALDLQLDALEEEATNLDTAPGAEDLAYIMFTSGSTGKPKGVLIEHRGIVRLVQNTNYFRLGPECRLLMNGALSFDATTFEIWGMLLHGGYLHIVDKDILTGPHRFAEETNKYQINSLWLTTGYFNQIVDENPELFRPVKQLVTGGERMSVIHTNKLRQLYPDLSVKNVYGPTENTTFSLFHDLQRDYHESIPLGLPISNSTVYIVDDNLQPVPVGIDGEICVGGDGLSRGYLNNDELTAEKFVDNPFGRKGTKIYRTGDLGRWNSRGEVEFIGRKDFQVKVRGYRVEPGEIETLLTEHPAISEAVILTPEAADGLRYLVAYYTFSGQAVSEEELTVYLKQELPDFMVPSFLVPMQSFPLNTNGKIDRKALPDPLAAGQVSDTEYVAPVTDIQKQIAAIWTDILGVEQVGITDNFFDLGGHSLKATQLISRLHKEMGLELELKDVFEEPTVESIARLADTRGGEETTYQPIPSLDRQPQYELSHAQRRLWLLDQFENAGSAYNVPLMRTVPEALEPEQVEKAFVLLIERHESLRTNFAKHEGEPVQVIHDPSDVSFNVQYHDLRDKEAKEQIASEILSRESHRSFDLENDLLFTVTLVQLEDSLFHTMINMHHIISDAWSLDILFKEFETVYRAVINDQEPQLAELPIQYRDYAAWQKAQLETEDGLAHQAYWVDQFSGEVPAIELPVDRSRPKAKTFNGRLITKVISPEVTEGLNAIARKHEATLFVTLLAGVNALLHRYSGQNDIVVGSPIAGRNHPDVEGQIGFYVNTLALRNYPESAMSFTALVDRVKSTTFGAYEHQIYPFDLLVEKVDKKRDISRSPLFDVMVILQNAGIAETDKKADSSHLRDDLVPREDTAKYELGFNFREAGDRIELGFTYNSDLFDDETAIRMVDHLHRLLEGVVAAPETSLGNLPLLSETDRTDLIRGLNPAFSVPDPRPTIVSLFRNMAASYPYSEALADRSKVINYRELDELTDKIAVRLRNELGITANDAVAIHMPNSMDTVVAILSIIKAGAAYVPVHIDNPAERINFMLSDTSAKALIVMQGETEAPANAPCPVFTIGEMILQAESEEHNVPQYTVSPADLVYIIYTSGSTGRPKGVMLEHGSVALRMGDPLLVNLHFGDRVLSTVSLSFDASAIELFGTLTNGATLCFVPQEDYISADKLRNSLDEFRINKGWFSTGLFSRIVDEDPAAMSRLQEVNSGGDKMQSDRIKKLMHVCPDLKIVNAYGPTENAIFSSGYDVHHGFGDEISIGQPATYTRVYLLDENKNLLPKGATGEMYLGGEGVARGYLNLPELTDLNFFADPFSGREGDRMYKSGDLARWTNDGKLIFRGRVDQQVKVRGYRIELGEIENRLTDYKGITDACATTWVQQDGIREIVAYYQSDEALPLDDIRQFLAEYLPAYMVPAYYVHMQQFPLNHNDKVDKKALPLPEEAATHARNPYAAPRNEAEEVVAAIWQEVLGSDRIGINDNFFDLGGHSLKATQVVSRIYKKLGLQISLRQVFLNPTVADFCSKLDIEGKEQAYQTIPKAEKSETYPATHAQKRMWVLEQFEDGGMQAFNMPSAHVLQGTLDADALTASLENIIRRHESLRTVFVAVSGEPRQKVIPIEQFGLPMAFTDLSNDPDKESKIKEISNAEVSEPFSLSDGPLIRINLLKLEADKHLLLLTLHHIVSDGWSMQVFTRELFDGYNALRNGGEYTIDPLTIQYTDYAVWMEEYLSGGELNDHRQFWTREFSGTVPVLNLPTDRPRPRVQTHRGSVAPYLYPASVTEKLSTLAGKEQASLYMALIAGVNTLFYRYTGQTDIVIGSPIAGRHHGELEDLIGLFLNTLPIRSTFTSDMSFRELLAEVKTHTLGAFEHQVYPVDLLIDELDLPRDLSRSPLFDVLVVLQNMSAGEAEGPMGELSIAPAGQELTASKFDLSFYFSEEVNGISLGLEYNTDLYDQSTVQRMMHHLHQVIEAVVMNPDAPISELEYISREEKEVLRDQFSVSDNHFESDFIPVTQLIHTSREEIALRSGDVSVTYAEMATLTEKVANAIISAGVQKGQPVVLFTERNERMVAAMLGALKAGTPYVPVDIEYPAGRIDTILSDAEPKLILTDNASALILDQVKTDIPLVKLDDLQSSPASAEIRYPVIAPDDPAYILYTSGSTGMPKGVVVSHGAMSGYSRFAASYFALTQTDVVVQQASLTFDTSVEEIFPVLISGGTLAIAQEGGRDIEGLLNLVEKHNCTVLSSTPLVIREINKAPERINSLRVIISGGDRLRHDHIDSIPGHISLYNTYGPTEATVCATYHKIEDRSQTDIIGKPVAGKRIYILDESNRLQAIGVPGEICIAGEGLAVKYLNRPEQTEASFVADPFVEGARMYRTGDNARWTSEGTIKFEGRKDDQVKIRGHRVEPGEVEACLAGYEGVEEAIVIIPELGEGQDSVLLGFVQSAMMPHEQDIRNYLLSHLPPYMVPSRIHTLMDFPRNTAGKVDRKELLDISRTESAGFRPFVMPRTESEEQVAAIWKQVLESEEDISVVESFFDMGGDSMKLVKLRQSLEELAGVEIKVAKLFELHTIEAIAAWLDEREGSQKESTEIVSF